MDLEPTIPDDYQDPDDVTGLSPQQQREYALAIAQQKKLLQNKIGELDSELGTWTRRVNLAEEHGKLELAGEARRKVADLEHNRRQLTVELQEMEVSLQNVARQMREPSGLETQKSAQLLADLEAMIGMTGEEAKMDRQLTALSAEEKLAQLKARMRPPDPPSE